MLCHYPPRPERSPHHEPDWVLEGQYGAAHCWTPPVHLYACYSFCSVMELSEPCLGYMSKLAAVSKLFEEDPWPAVSQPLPVIHLQSE